jgi:translation elongation factor EF-G
MTCLYGAQYIHSADIYTMSEVSIKATGQKKKTWAFEKSVPCLAKAVSRNSISGSTAESYAKLYEAYTHIRIKTSERINLSSKVTNIKSNGDVVWMEDDGEPTVFEVIGLIPVLDMFGGLNGYEVLCNRSSDQRINP